MSAERSALQIIYDLAIQARTELRAIRPMPPLNTRRKIATIANLAFINSRGSTAPVEELESSYPVVLYFAEEKDRDEFIEIVRDAHPNLEPRRL
jgi:hypothetical protein